MKLNKAQSFLLVLSLVSIAAMGDVTLEQQITIEARGLISVFESEKTRLTRISGDRARIEGFDGERSGVPEDTLDHSSRTGSFVHPLPPLTNNSKPGI